jgi:hypothetical protein
VKKLREAAEDLRSYERSAVPEGWSCHWDRYCIRLNTTSMSRTTFLPCEIFQVKEKPSFWISKKLTCLRNLEIFHSLTFQAFVNRTASFYPLLYKEIKRVYDKTSRTKGIIFYIVHLAACVASTPVVVFTKWKAVDIYGSVPLYEVGLDKDKLSIQSTKNRKSFMTFLCSLVYTCTILHVISQCKFLRHFFQFPNLCILLIMI